MKTMTPFDGVPFYVIGQDDQDYTTAYKLRRKAFETAEGKGNLVITTSKRTGRLWEYTLLVSGVPIEKIRDMAYDVAILKVLCLSAYKNASIYSPVTGIRSHTIG